jgi:hypothetical protein
MIDFGRELQVVITEEIPGDCLLLCSPRLARRLFVEDADGNYRLREDGNLSQEELEDLAKTGAASLVSNVGKGGRDE